MRELATDGLRTGACALDDVHAHMDALEGSPFARVPGTAMMLLDADLRILRILGPLWADMGIDPADVTGRLLTDVSPAARLTRTLPEYQAVLAGELRSFSLPVDAEHT